MERNARHTPGPITSLFESLWSRFSAHKSPRDPDRDQIFSDSIERAMILRELHGR
jgi:hypothetical protein